MSSIWKFALFQHETSFHNPNKVQPTARLKCKCITLGSPRGGNDDISSVVSQCYSSCRRHRSAYRLYYSQLMAIRLSSGQRSLHSSAETHQKKKRKKKEGERDEALSFCFVIKFSLSPTAPTTFPLISPSTLSLLLFLLNLSYRTHIIHFHLCIFNI